MFGRWRKKRDLTPPPITVDLGKVLVERIACHFGEATIDGQVIDLGFGGLRLSCRVAELTQAGGGYQAASLFFELSGGPLGDTPVFMSASGYDTDPHDAVVLGACNWACTFGPVLQAAFTNATHPDLEEHRVTIDGRAYRLVGAMMDRAMMFGEGDPGQLIADARSGLGFDLAKLVAESGSLPALVGPTVISVFVSDSAHGRITEVKVNGCDWQPAAETFAAAPAGSDSGVALLRELAVLVPLEELPFPERSTLERTFAGLAARATGPEMTAGWRGWRAHGGELAPALSAAELDALDAAVGPLPAEYRAFLGTVAGSGAGPGYGLLPARRVDDLIPLAHAGCGVVWVLRMDSAHYGEVWCDAAGSDETYRRVAGGFAEWYREWLRFAIGREQEWLQWDFRCCAPVNLFSTMLNEHSPAELAEMIEPGGIRTTGGGRYVPEGSAIDPCHGCVGVAHRLGMSEDVFAPGVLTA
ncbi:SMI1/KNR4 family protein [Longispora albida]|uniref:SMI1/KNR4 family protein n=1 Tax=Longispora albida TaxID=203523 RepID=UPI00036A4DCA|nr:SMI1/KNR4 family protein [Longispora albida]